MIETLERVPLTLRQSRFTSPRGGEVGMCAPRARIPGEGVTNREGAGPPNPDRASAIRPLPCGERCRKLQDRVMIERHRDLR